MYSIGEYINTRTKTIPDSFIAFPCNIIGNNTKLTQTASCKYGLKVALNSIKSRGRRDYGARYYNSLLFN